MPIKPTQVRRRIQWVALAAVAGTSLSTIAQTDDATPFYVGGTLGMSRVSNIYRQSTATNDDTVTSIGLLGGIDERYGRQHVKLDGSLQNNRYSTNKDLNNRSYSLQGALDWQTIANLSGVLSARSERSLADFNIGGVDPIFKKNIERSDEYQALARLGVVTRYTLEGGWSYRRREFSAEEYARFAFHQNTATLGVYATPGSNVRLGLSGRHTKGQNPRYPVGITIDPETLGLVIVSAPNDYTRNDLDFTTRWTTGGSSSLNTRISRSRTQNSLIGLRDFTGTTGSVGWNWQPTAKLLLNVQFARDTGQETTTVQAADLNKVYTSWQLGGNYAITSKVSLSAKATSNRARRTSDTGATLPDALDDNKYYNVGVRWAFSRSMSLGCQYDHASRDSSVPQYVYSANSYGCTGQVVLY